MEKDANWLLQEKYNCLETPEYLNDLLRLKAGEPLAYIIGHVPFLNCTIHLDSKPLIPRPETEFWVDCCINELKRRVVSLAHPPQREYSERGLDEIKTPLASDSKNPEQYQGHSAPCQATTLHEHGIASLKILDLCAGSGCVGVAIGNAIPEAHVTFGEIDPLHAPTILKNSLANGIPEDRFTITTSDLLKNITGQFDFILSNPPYIDPALDRAELSVKVHEPYQALYGGKGGTELIERIIASAPARLSDNGQLLIEHEPEQAEFIARRGDINGFDVTTHHDQYGVVRYSLLVLK